LPSAPSTGTIRETLDDPDERTAAMFADAYQRTPLDLNFRLFRIPIRVHPLHWVISAVLGQDWFRVGGFWYLVLWIFCVFFSILIHEMGHVLMGRVFGSNGEIVLYSFGGLAIGSNDLRRRWQRILVLFAGPGAQFLLFGVVWVVAHYLPYTDPSWGQPLAAATFMLLVINLWWPILNLLPIWPLDGGQITRELLEGVRPNDGMLIALAISAVVSGALAISAFLRVRGGDRIPWLDWLPYLSPITGLFFLMFCVNSIMMIYVENQRRRRHDDDRFPWE
jgi:Zn-dependent protease